MQEQESSLQLAVKRFEGQKFPMTQAKFAELMDVSRMKINRAIANGQLQSVDWMGKKHISRAAALAYATLCADKSQKTTSLETQKAAS